MKRILGKQPSDAPLDPVRQNSFSETSFPSQFDGEKIAEIVTESLLSDPSTVFAFLKSAHPTWFELAIKDPLIAHTINTADNGVGVSLFGAEPSTDNRQFDATQPNISVEIIEDTTRHYPQIFMMVLHDCRHHCFGGVLPLYKEEGEKLSTKVVPKEDYIRQELLFEMECIYFSEIHCHRVIGYEKVAAALGNPSLGAVLEKLGFIEESSQRKALESLFLDHKIPDGEVEKLDVTERYVLLATIERGKIDKALSGHRWDVLTRTENILDAACNLKINPLALSFEEAQERIDSGFAVEMQPLSHNPLRQYFLGLRNAILRKEQFNLLVCEKGNEALLSNEDTTWKLLAKEIEQLLSQDEITIAETKRVLAPYFARDPEYLSNLVAIPIDRQSMDEESFPSIGLFDPKSVQFEYPSNYSATRWDAYIVSADIVGRNPSLKANRKYHDFVGWKPGSNENGPLQLNFHLWPDARLYGYKPRCEGKTKNRQSWYLTTVEPMPDFSYDLLEASIVRDVSGGTLRKAPQEELLLDEKLDAVRAIFNSGFSALGFKECSSLRKPLLMTPCNSTAVQMEGTPLADVFGNLLPEECQASPLLTRYGHEILERIVRAIYGSPSLSEDEIAELRADPGSADRFHQALSERYLDREQGAAYFAHVEVNDLVNMDTPITRMGRMNSENSSKKDLEVLLGKILWAQRPSVFQIQDSELNVQLERLHEIGNNIDQIAHKKLVLLERYGSSIDYAPYLPGEKMMWPGVVSRCIASEEDSFPQFMLSNFKAKTLYPIIVSYHILKREIDSLLESNSDLLRGGEFHGRSVYMHLDAYERNLQTYLQFFDSDQLCTSDGTPSPHGRFLAQTRGAVCVDELIDGATRMLNENLRSVEQKLMDIFQLDALLSPDQVAIYKDSEDVFGKIQLMAGLLCYRATEGVNLNIALEPFAVSFDELLATRNLTPFDLFRRRADTIPEEALLTAEVEHDVKFPRSRIFNFYAFNCEMYRVRSKQGVDFSEQLEHIRQQFGEEGFFTVNGAYPEEYRRVPKISLKNPN